MHERPPLPRDPRWVVTAEICCLVLLLAWLMWLPLPFGSVTDFAQPPLIGVPLFLCAAAALIRAWVMRARPIPLVQTVAYRTWTAGAIFFALVVAFQLVPLPPSLLQSLSPESSAIWQQASRVASLALASPVTASHPISVDPSSTWLHLFRFLAYFAAFQASALLVRRHRRRVALAAALCFGAIFQILYGVQATTTEHYRIWGWENSQIFNRVSGTFVNPNHFADYLAIIIPVAIYLSGLAWHASRPGAPMRRRIAELVEKRMIPFGFGIVTALGCLAAVLVAQSRGALVAIAAGMTIVLAMRLRSTERDAEESRGRRRAPAKLAAFVVAGALLLAALVEFLGHERTVARFSGASGEDVTLSGRISGVRTASELWRLFPLFGSGLGTFESVVSIAQKDDLDKLLNHAHDDYAEILATTGSAGFMIMIVSVVAGYVAFVRMTFGRAPSWNRHAFHLAALASITIALIHGLFDFNFFIPANPATLATIAGAAVASRE